MLRRQVFGESRHSCGDRQRVHRERRDPGGRECSALESELEYDEREPV